MAKTKDYEAHKYKLNQNRLQAIAGKQKYYKALIQKGEQKVQECYQRKLSRALKKIEDKYVLDMKELEVQEGLYELSSKKKTDKTMTKIEINKIESTKRKLEQIKTKKEKNKKKEKTIKQKAFDMVQLYARIYWSDQEGYVTLADTGKRVLYSQCQGGHYYPKKNYPQLVFNVYNICPITAYTNKVQGDNIGNRWEEGFIKTIGKEKYQEIVSIAGDKREKNILHDTEYYLKKMEYFKSKAIIEFMKRGLPLPKLLK